MAQCVPFLGVPDIAQTIKWYENIGFTCVGTNHYWEPDCELNWAQLEWQGATFMLYPYPLPMDAGYKYASLYFMTESIDEFIEHLNGKATIVEINEATFYGRKEVVFKDLNGFQVTFSCEAETNAPCPPGNE